MHVGLLGLEGDMSVAETMMPCAKTCVLSKAFKPAMIRRRYTAVIVLVRFSLGGGYSPSVASASRCFSTRSCGALLSPAF